MVILGANLLDGWGVYWLGPFENLLSHFANNRNPTRQRGINNHNPTRQRGINNHNPTRQRGIQETTSSASSSEAGEE